MAFEYSDSFRAPDAGEFEVVERKGLGHPDTLVDGIVESSELDYATYCKDRFGAIPHHNLDKASMLGGLCVQEYGGGEFEAPVELLFMGRASRSYGGEPIPIEDIQFAAADRYLRRVMPHLDIDDPNVYRVRSLTSDRSTRPHWFAPRSLEDLPEYAGKPTANDTATMISYWPLTDTEQVTLDLEGYFYEDDDDGLPRPRFDHIGQDIKVMSVRYGNQINVTLAVPQITTHTPDLNTYLERMKETEAALQDYAATIIGDRADVRVTVNTASRGKNPRPYFVTGGSCTDFGEEGAVGRGNKTHGIISSLRPNTMEAPQGKNPTYFVGKVLGYQADLIARSVYERLGTRCQVILQANIGDYLYDPSRVIVSTEDTVSAAAVRAIVDDCMGLGRETTDRIISERHFLPRAHSWKGEDANT